MTIVQQNLYIICETINVSRTTLQAIGATGINGRLTTI